MSDAAGVREPTLGPVCREAWRAACVALPRSLPVLWTAVRPPSGADPRVSRLCAHVVSGTEEVPPVVDGPSFGLAFTVLVASHVFGIPAPADLVASATVDVNGHVGRVDGLALKIETVTCFAPRVVRVVVAASQVDEARRIAARVRAPARRRPLEIVGVVSAAAALRVAFGAAVEQRLVRAGASMDQRHEIARSFLRLALDGCGAAIDWTPVERAAGLALAEWSTLDDDERFALEFARAVAGRHEGNRGECPQVDAARLAAWPRPLQLQVIAHLVQQAADTGKPSPREVEKLAAAAIPERLADGLGPHWKVAGALARLWAVTGRPGEARARQETLAGLAVAVFDYAQVSFPLAEWLRLAGALQDEAAFERACGARAHVEAVGGLASDGADYVTLAWARGCVGLGRAGAAVEALRRLSERGEAPAHVRHGAARWLVRAWRLTGEVGRARDVRSRLVREAEGGGRGAESAAKQLALVDLDEVLWRDETGFARLALVRLTTLERGLVTMLTAVGGGDAPAYVARSYPY